MAADEFSSTSDLISMCSISEEGVRAAVRRGQGSSTCHSEGGGTLTPVGAAPQVSDDLVDLIHLHAVEFHDGSEANTTSRRMRSGQVPRLTIATRKEAAAACLRNRASTQQSSVTRLSVLRQLDHQNKHQGEE